MTLSLSEKIEKRWLEKKLTLLTAADQLFDDALHRLNELALKEIIEYEDSKQQEISSVPNVDIQDEV